MNSRMTSDKNNKAENIMMTQIMRGWSDYHARRVICERESLIMWDMCMDDEWKKKKKEGKGTAGQHFHFRLSFSGRRVLLRRLAKKDLTTKQPAKEYRPLPHCVAWGSPFK